MKVILYMTTSLNGIIATPDNKEDFLSDENWVEFVKIVQKSGCLIWGYKTYELVKAWNESYIEPLNKIVKIVVSSKLNSHVDEGFLLATSPQEAIQIAREKGFDEVILSGGSKNNSAFAKLNLIDEIIINIEGVIIGKGIPMFNPDDFKLKLNLQESINITDNVIQLHFEVIK